MFKTLAAALFCGAMLLTLTACGSDNDSKKTDDKIIGVQAQYYVAIKDFSFEGYFFEIEYTNESGQMEKVVLDDTPKFEKSVLVKGLPVAVELKVEAKPRNKASLTKSEYDCGFDYGLGAASVTSSGKSWASYALTPNNVALYGMSVDNMGSVNRRMVVTVDKDGNLSW